jgi:ribose transport system substrate-binding protein
MEERYTDLDEELKRAGMTRHQLMIRAATLGLTAPVMAGALASGAGARSAPVVGAAGKKVVDLGFGLAFEFQVGLHNAVRRVAKNNKIRLTVLDGQADPNRQATQADDVIAQKPDAILFDPIDPNLIAPSIKKANKAKIPSFVLEVPVKVPYKALVLFDNVAGGAMAADWLANVVGKKGSVIETMGALSHPAAQGRNKGFNNRMKAKYPNIKVRSLNTEWTADNALTMVLDAFTRDPDIVGIYSHNDEMIKGIVTALKQLGKSGKIPVIGNDGTPLALDRIRDGTQSATVNMDPGEMGGLAMLRIVQYFSGKKFAKITYTKPKLVTKANVNSKKWWGNTA